MKKDKTKEKVNYFERRPEIKTPIKGKQSREHRKRE